VIQNLVAVLVHGFSLFRAETAHLPAAVLAWMWAMRIVLGASIAFLPRRGAIAAFAVMLVTAVSRFLLKGFHPEVPSAHIGASVHVVLWLPLAIFLLWTLHAERKTADTLMDRAYGVWLIAEIAVIVISLVFDIREMIGVFA